ncbi:alpha-N-acetylglucosaminidase [Bacteroides finegoldii]|uniref:alpha-N-acetylglucosaminidase n=1 Tax=Bacteroides finegoldii TaxID=338188 RepID=UPI0022E4D0B6|nr:alpha-N-acetylglucosaminidase [Bacteroides finegoldii]
MKKIFSVLFFLVVICQIRAEDTNITTMRKMTQRLFPQQASFFDFRLLNDTSTDTFTIKSEGNKIIISGNNANSMAVGLNHYLKNYCLTTISWYKDDPIELPKTLPNIPAEVTIKANVPTRFFLNYCTFGYSMTWWKWSDWEHFIDWMALNGINMPLAITGQEAIWYKVWSKLGLTDEEIRGYFTGPAHLPWHRMCNLDGWQSPLPKEWLSSQAELQEQIVAREREFNMQPVLPAFAGHVPAALKRVYPNIKTSRVSEWGGFADQYRCTFLNPMDSLYAIIQKEYLTEQTRLYGTNHIYGIDPFNEIDPPSWDADSLGMMAKHIYESVAAVDPEAIWLQMTWLFYADIKHWTTARIKSYLRSVPQDKLILLDYFCEYTEIWKQTDSYFGQPYLWCYLGNFGGNSFLSGPVKLVSERLADALKNGGSNLKGVGSTLEGIDLNQFMYEFVLDKAWNSGQTDKEWFLKLADRRTGKVSPEARKAWEILADKVYIQPAQVGQGTLTNARPCLKGNGHWTTKPTIEYQPKDLVEAWRLLLSVKDCQRDSYEFDLVNIGRQVLGNYFNVVRDEFTLAYEAGDIMMMKNRGDKMREILTDLDKLVSCHPTFSLNKWITDARDMGHDAASKNYYEMNARSLITIWGDSYHLTDYANRSWAGLTNQYYSVRWDRFINEVIKAVEKKKAFDEEVFFNESRMYENEWVNPSNRINYNEGGDGIKLARQIYKKYAKEIIR